MVCKEHKSYRAMHAPRATNKHPSGCQTCWRIYNMRPRTEYQVILPYGDRLFFDTRAKAVAAAQRLADNTQGGPVRPLIVLCAQLTPTDEVM